MRFKIKESFALKLSLYIITAVVIIFIIVLIHNYRLSKRLILENNTQHIRALEEATLNRIDIFLSVTQRSTDDLSAFLEYSDPSENELQSMLKGLTGSFNINHGVTVFFAPYKFDKSKKFFAPTSWNTGNGSDYCDLANQDFDYLQNDVYKEGAKQLKGFWSEPYFDKDKKTLLLSYSKAFYELKNGKKEFGGVVSCDIPLEWIEEFISEIKIFDSGYAYIISPNSTFIAHPNKDYYRQGQSLFALSEKYNDEAVRKISQEMISGKTGYSRYFSHNKAEMCYIYYQPLKKVGWSLGIVVPENELFSRLDSVTLDLFVIGIIGYLMTLVMTIFLSRRATMPLRSLARATYKIGQGDFNAAIPKNTSLDEIGLLSSSFVSMQSNLIKYVKNLKESTAAREKIEQELNIAREIQESIIPHNFPKAKEFDLYAKLIPAREVGGDLYDFFFIDETHLCFAVGDVSGKGVGAALFMAITKTLLRAKTGMHTNPGEVISAMNKELCMENDSAMFVTFFLCILDVRTGEIEYCNAGHNPPIINTANKGFCYLRSEQKPPPLGVMDDALYTSNKLKLLSGDIFFLYTDGVTEATNKDDIEFSEEKLLTVLSDNADSSVTGIISQVRTAVACHVSGADQSDDITMLVLKYNG